MHTHYTYCIMLNNILHLIIRNIHKTSYSSCKHTFPNDLLELETTKKLQKQSPEDFPVAENIKKPLYKELTLD